MWKDAETFCFLVIEILESAVTSRAVSQGGLNLNAYQQLISRLQNLLLEKTSPCPVFIQHAPFVQLGHTNESSEVGTIRFPLRRSYRGASLQVLNALQALEACFTSSPGQQPEAWELQRPHQVLDLVSDVVKLISALPDRCVVVLDSCTSVQIGQRNTIVSGTDTPPDQLPEDRYEDNTHFYSVPTSNLLQKFLPLNNNWSAAKDLTAKTAPAEGKTKRRNVDEVLAPLQGDHNLDLRLGVHVMTRWVRELLKVKESGLTESTVEVWHRNCPNIQIGIHNTIVIQPEAWDFEETLDPVSRSH